METFCLKPRIYFGSDALGALEALAGKRVLVVTDGFLAKSGLLDKLKGALRGCTVEVFDQVIPDPPLELVARGVHTLESAQPEAMVAFGGGSPPGLRQGNAVFFRPAGTALLGGAHHGGDRVGGHFLCRAHRPGEGCEVSPGG